MAEFMVERDFRIKLILFVDESQEVGSVVRPVDGLKQSISLLTCNYSIVCVKSSAELSKRKKVDHGIWHRNLKCLS
jgi:hypothetical protein